MLGCRSPHFVKGAIAATIDILDEVRVSAKSF